MPAYISNRLLLLHKVKEDGFGGVAIAFKSDIAFDEVKYDNNQMSSLRNRITFNPTWLWHRSNFPSPFKKEIRKLIAFLLNRPNTMTLGNLDARSIAFGDTVN